jgi:DNA repair exonuclease SbcCD ATPase subunit
MEEHYKEEKKRTEDYYKNETDKMSKEHEAEIAKLNEEKNKLSKKYGKKLKEIRESMDKNQYEQEKKKITDELKAEMNKERTEYEEKIEKQEIQFKALKKSMEEAQRLALTEIDNKLKEREEEIMNLNKQIEDERKQAEEDKRKIKADANRDKEEKVAQVKNKMEERHEKDKEELLEEAQRNQKEIYGFAPTLEAYIKKKLSTQAYSLDEDELIDKIARDIGKPGGLPRGTDPKEVAKAIYNRGAEETIKHIKKIANLAILTGYNHDLYNKLPGDVAQEVQRYITDKINDDIRRKNIKYILPKDKPRWEHAMETKQLNPMLGRSAWRVN